MFFFRKMRFKEVRFNIEISKVTGPNFTGLVSPNKKGGLIRNKEQKSKKKLSNEYIAESLQTEKKFLNSQI